MNYILKVLPFFLRNKLEGREEFKKIILNSGWLFFDKILRMGAGLLVGVWIARYLGPSQFGIFNYAIAFTVLFSAFATLGLDSIVIRELIKYPDKKDFILGTSFILRFVASFITLIFTLITIIFLRPEDQLSQYLVIIIAAGSLFLVFDIIDFYFQAKVLSRYTVIAKSVAFLITLGLKIFLIISELSLIYFAWAALLETFLGAFFLVVAFRRNNENIRNWRFDKETARNLLINGWPLILSGIVILIYMRIDQVILGEIIGDKAVGIYSTAVRLSEVWYFIPMAITSSVFPAVIKAKQTSQEVYEKRLQQLYSIMTWISICIALAVTISGKFIILFLFGNEYIEASGVLTVYIWSGVATFLGVASSQFLMTENLTKISFYRTLIGMIFNLLLNIILIPKYGAMGAAIATLISYTIATFAIVLFKSSRSQFLLMMRSFNPFLLKNILQS